jgi:hypothetical protein
MTDREIAVMFVDYYAGKPNSEIVDAIIELIKEVRYVTEADICVWLESQPNFGSVKWYIDRVREGKYRKSEVL